MASMKVLLLLLGLAVTTVVGQYRPISGLEERALELGQNPALLEIAAMTGEMVVVFIDGPSVTTIVQEGVNFAMSCLPWLQRFPGGSIAWSRLLLDTDGMRETKYFHFGYFRPIISVILIIPIANITLYA